jgi:hypothetical protein
MELGLRLKADVITFAFVRYFLSTIYQAVLALICILFVPIVCGIADSSLVLGPPRMQARVSRLYISIPKKELAMAPRR